MTVVDLAAKRREAKDAHAMESFEALINLGLLDLRYMGHLIGRHAQCKEAYTEPATAVYLLGMLAGLTYRAGEPARTVLMAIKEVHDDMIKNGTIRPCDVIGDTRLYFKTGHYPPSG
jgi:hypothetical protein